ncbi:MAG: hypothetical protein PHG00_09425 [Methylococcales bacterium]|nr:hypothetical protein [Methylococcales bacterium]
MTSPLAEIRNSGFSLALANGSLEVKPASALTQQQRQFLKTHKAEIIEELTSENNPVEWRDYTEPDIKNPLTVTCYTPAGSPVMIKAKDEAHKAFLLEMNPAPKAPTITNL